MGPAELLHRGAPAPPAAAQHPWDCLGTKTAPGRSSGKALKQQHYERSALFLEEENPLD